MRQSQNHMLNQLKSTNQKMIRLGWKPQEKSKIGKIESKIGKIESKIGKIKS